MSAIDYICLMGLLSALASDRWAAGTGLLSALAILPLPAHAHSPELAAALAVAAVAVLAGHRWALGALIIAEVFLVAAVWPAAFLARPPGESFFSTSVTEQVPRAARCVAAESPAKPDPITTTCVCGMGSVVMHVDHQALLE